MANYYIDLDLVSGGSGTELDPWSGPGYHAALGGLSTADDFFLRGSWDVGGQFNFITDGSTYQAWDLSLYGPWRIRATSTSTGGSYSSTFIGLIIEQTAGSLSLMNLINSYAISSGNIYLNGSVCTGCAINVSSGGFTPSGVITDTVVTANSYLFGGYAATLNNCALTGWNASYTDGGGNQTDWVAPILPAWDADQSAFAVATLFADVDTPPQPGLGSPAYTGYTMDLWGNARTGIGTGLMGVLSSPPSWISTYPKASTITYNSIQVLGEIDQDGTIYYQVLAKGTLAPTSAAIKANPEGFIVVTADTEGSFTITRLDPVTPYDIYVVAENGSADLQESPELLEISTINIPYRPAPSGSPDSTIGMPPKGNSTGGSLQHSDTNLGNPQGDKVDNSAGHNNADKPANGGPVSTVRGGGSSVGISSKPSWLH